MNKLKIYISVLLAALMLTSCVGISETTDSTDTSVVAPEPSPYGVIGVENAKEIWDVSCQYALLTKLDGLEAVAKRNASEIMYPASMTKVMTFIVAYENADSFDAQTELTKEIQNRYAHVGASRVGIYEGTLMTTEQLLYALLLESDTDSAVALAEYVAGGEEEFVKLMNAKCKELGLTSTKFANITGLHDKEHYTTVEEMTSIFAYALGIELFRKIITTDTYVTYLDYYEDGVLKNFRMTFKNTTISRDKGRFAKNNISLSFSNGAIIGGKTGYTDEAKYCLALLVKDADGKEYILITAKSSTARDNAADSLCICKEHIN